MEFWPVSALELGDLGVAHLVDSLRSPSRRLSNGSPEALGPPEVTGPPDLDRAPVSTVVPGTEALSDRSVAPWNRFSDLRNGNIPFDQ
jgi:hypothetical protein